MTPVADQALTLPDLEARERDLERLHEQARAEAAELGIRQQRIDDINEQLDRLRADYAEADRRIDRLAIESPLASRIEVINWGELPTMPHNQGQRLQMLVFGGGVGAMLGVGLVMLVGRNDRRIRHIDQAQGNLPSGTPLLGILPSLPDDPVTPEEVALTAHCVHQIRTRLQVSLKQTPNPVVVLTSPLADSGKTSLSIALGLSFASSDTRTLLIDCDLTGAGLSDRLNLTVRQSLAQVLRSQQLVSDEQLDEARQLALNTGRAIGDVLVELGRISREDLQHARQLREASSLGLVDVCEGEPLSSCIAATGIKHLALLPLGAEHRRHAAALSPVALKRVFDQARRHFDIILVDTGPTPGSIEGAMVAAEADRTVLVVSCGDEKPSVTQAVDQLEGVGANLAGVVFNHAPAEDLQFAYYTSSVSRPSAVNRLSAGEDALAGQFARVSPASSSGAATAFADDDAPDDPRRQR